jgi:hypothetical protein
MNNIKTLYEQIKSDTLGFLRDSSEKLLAEQIKEFIEDSIKIKAKWRPGENVDAEALYREVATLFSIWCGDETVLDNNEEDHKEWLSEVQGSIKWKLWNRYYDFLIKEEGLPPEIVEKTDKLTQKILERLENPKRPGSWDRRGMVVGDVQSGKTSNFTGLACKAADAGYKYVIILSGMTDDLRSQTQKRMDRGFLGYDSAKKDQEDQSETRIGVGRLPEYESIVVHSVTSREHKGDFSKKVYSTVSVRAGGDPILFVVKKNAIVLKNLLKEFSRYATNGKFKDMPILVIDDEADSASVDGKAVERDESGKPLKDQDPATINGLIRQILNLFAQSAYVGYTATPFANIFIYPKTETDFQKYNEDLFPRSFIISIPSPDNYIGPVKVFGLKKDGDEGEKIKGLPIVIKIDDYERCIPKKHNKDHIIQGGLPKSLLHAIKCFIITCAARATRGQNKKHNSMLIHVTRLNNVQMQLTDLVWDEVRRLQRLVSLGTGKLLSSLMDELQSIWETEYASKYQEICENTNDLGLTPLSWDNVKAQMEFAASKIEVKAINGLSVDGGLNYDDYPNGMSVIAVGGDKLSRGLTLEGLSISYYTRASKMYDSLLQMGRWFGYKPGFVDLCRLYTSAELIKWYQHITVANEELKREFDCMARQGANPEEYGLRVRTHPDGLLITSTNKMRNAKNMEVCFAGHLVETTRFYRKNTFNHDNFMHTVDWLNSLPIPTRKPKEDYSGFFAWNVSGEEIVSFLDGYSIHPMSRNATPALLEEYISVQISKGELADWTVALISSSKGKATKNIGKYQVQLPYRGESDKDDDKIIMLNNRHMITEAHEGIDLTRSQKEEALKATIEDWKDAPKDRDEPQKSSPQQLRRHREATNGLLLLYPLQIMDDEGNPQNEEPIIGFAISFPDSENAEKVKYKANNTYWRNLYESED